MGQHRQERKGQRSHCGGFAGPAATLRRGHSNNRVLYVATLSTGPYLLLEGATPTAIFYPRRRGENKRRTLPVFLYLRGTSCPREPRR
jgi:hypothetical protein